MSPYDAVRWLSGAHRVEPQPLRPVAAQLEEVIEVGEPCLLELVDQVRDSFVAGERPNGDQGSFHAKLVGREVESLVERRTCERRGIERRLANEQRGRRCRNVDWHSGLL